MSTSWSIKKRTSYPALKEDISTDIVIVGGGITGILSAYFLSRIGKKVVLLEADRISEGVTEGTTAFVTQAIDTNLNDLVSIFGKKHAKAVWGTGSDAITEIEKIIKREKIECDFLRCSAYILSTTAKQLKRLTAEHEMASELGFSTKILKAEALPLTNLGSLELIKQAKFHPLKFVLGVAAATAQSGVQIFENSEVVELSETGKVELRTKNGSIIRAKDVVLATYLPFHNPKETHFKKGMYKSYVLEAELVQTDLKEGLYWDTANPYTYFRIDHSKKTARIIIGGQDHRADIPVPIEKNFQALESQLCKILPATPYKITKRWYGSVLESSDGLPLIGAYRPHRYLATAFSGNGMTYLVVAAKLLSDLISGKKNQLTDLYSPTRMLSPHALYKKGLDYGGRLFGGAVKTFLGF